MLGIYKAIILDAHNYWNHFLLGHLCYTPSALTWPYCLLWIWVIYKPLAVAEMNWMRKTARYTWPDYKTSWEIAKEL